MASSRLNNPNNRYDYPNEIVNDEAGQVIRRSVQSYGARGLEPAYYLDEFGDILEKGYIKKVNLYREKANADLGTKLSLIDERLADLTFDGKDLMQRLVSATKDEAETNAALNGAAAVVGLVASLIGTPATGAAVTAALKGLIPLFYDGNHTDKYKKKINALEKEANYLLISKNKLLGEYAKLTDAEKAALALQRSSGEAKDNTTLYVIIAVILILIIRKRLKRK